MAFRRGASSCALMLTALLMVTCVSPRVAKAHGPVAPVASSFLARVNQVPSGLRASVIDGDQRMWLRVSRAGIVIVLDPRGAPYLRFSSSGVEVNQHSEMYYLNQSPAQTPPASLTSRTSARWRRIARARDYVWHDGRLHALATVAHQGGSAYVGRWTIPLLLDGHLHPMAGGLWRAPRPSIVWFWPIAVIVLCVWAARRVRDELLDLRVSRLLAAIALAASAVAAAGRELYGRPTVSGIAVAGLVIVLVFVAWGLHQSVFRRPGSFVQFGIASVAIWQGLALLPTLWNGFVLLAVPGFLARTATVLCIGCGAGLLLMFIPVGSGAERTSPRRQPDQSLEGGESFA